MNRKVSIVVALITLAALPPVFAQTAAPKAATQPAAGSPQEPVRPPAARAVATNADARLCLEFPTNLEVIKCAEKYLQHKRNG